MRMTRVLFVCLGNICRSPTAEGVFRARAEAAGLDVVIDSAGTGAWHAGSPPDGRSVAAAASRGYNLSTIRARQVRDADFHDFDHVLAMDAANLSHLTAMNAREGGAANVALFLDYAPDAVTREVPDPYYGGGNGFDHVLDLIEAASDGLIAALKS